MTERYFETKQLTVGYDGTPLISNINISLPKGAILTLIGPNGSGKSTILKSIIGQLKALGGAVYLNQTDIAQMNAKARAQKQAVVLTERPKTELMCCFDVVATGRYPYTNHLGILSDEDEKKVQEAMTMVHAYDIRNQSFETVSDGQKQRIMLARAICQEPEIIILDEPTSYLDIRHKLELLNILQRMAKKQKITVIMSLHEIDLAQKISDWIACVKGEYITQIGTPEEIFKEHTIHELYEVESGAYNNLLGSVEFPKTKGEPKIFVIAGDGTGIEIYRILQKKGIPFSTGILFTNDVDYQVAKAIASNVVTEQAFCAIEDDTYAKALYEMKQCEKVIYSGVRIEEGNKRIGELLQEAEREAKLITIEDVQEQ